MQLSPNKLKHIGLFILKMLALSHVMFILVPDLLQSTPQVIMLFFPNIINYFAFIVLGWSSHVCCHPVKWHGTLAVAILKS